MIILVLLVLVVMMLTTIITHMQITLIRLLDGVGRIIAIKNTELCKDMFQYHFPQADISLQAFIESSNCIESQSKELYNCIKTLLRKYLQANSISYREQYNMTNSIPLEQFAERLWPLIENKSYNDDKISMDSGYPTMLRISY